MVETNPRLRKIHKMLRKIVKKLGNKDLHFSAQIGVDSTRPDSAVVYGAYIDAPKEGLAPITFLDFTIDGLMGKLKNFYEEKINETQLEIAYHEAQIVANDRNTEHHKNQIELLKNPKTEDEDVQDELNPDEDEVRKNGEK